MFARTTQLLTNLFRADAAEQQAWADAVQREHAALRAVASSMATRRA